MYTGSSIVVIKYFTSNVSWIIPTFVAIIAIVVAIYFGKKSINRKKLGFFELYKNEIINLENTLIANDMEIYYKNESVSKIFLYTFELRNTGNVIIEKNDFIEEKNFSITFEGVRVLGFNIKTFSPQLESYDILIHHSDNEIKIPPFTLDVGEFIQFEIILDGLPVSIKKTYRIKGISALDFSDASKKLLLYSCSMFFFMLLYVILYSLNDLKKGYSHNLLDSEIFFNVWYQIFIYISLLGMFLSMIVFATILSKNPSSFHGYKSFLNNPLRYLFRSDK